MLYSELRPIIQSGDMILYRNHPGGGLRAEFERWVVEHGTASPYTHVGVAWAYRMGLSIARWAYGAIAYDGRGPIVTSASRSGAVITCVVDLNGAASIAGTALTGYAVSNDDFATLLTISSVDVVANQIVITLSGTPSGTVKVRSFREQNYDETTLALGTYSVEGITIPIFPIIDPITVT